MIGTLLTAALVCGAQQAGQWIQSPAGRKTLQTIGTMALMELGKHIEKRL